MPVQMSERRWYIYNEDLSFMQTIDVIIVVECGCSAEQASNRGLDSLYNAFSGFEDWVALLLVVNL